MNVPNLIATIVINLDKDTTDYINRVYFYPTYNYSWFNNPHETFDFKKSAKIYKTVIDESEYNRSANYFKAFKALSLNFPQYEDSDWFLIINTDEVLNNASFYKKIHQILWESREFSGTDLILISDYSEDTSGIIIHEEQDYGFFLDRKESTPQVCDFRNNNLSAFLIRKRRVKKILEDNNKAYWHLADVKKYCPILRILKLKQPLIVEKPSFTSNLANYYNFSTYYAQKLTKFEKLQLKMLKKFPKLYKNKFIYKAFATIFKLR